MSPAWYEGTIVHSGIEQHEKRVIHLPCAVGYMDALLRNRSVFRCHTTNLTNLRRYNKVRDAADRCSRIPALHDSKIGRRSTYERA